VNVADGGSGPTLCDEDGAIDCSACDAGYEPSAPFGAGNQNCSGERLKVANFNQITVLAGRSVANIIHGLRSYYCS
jgi:hypothetical protein